MTDTTHTPEEWTPLHAAARVACGDAFDGEATARMERQVRHAWEQMQTDEGAISEARAVILRTSYATGTAPVSTFRLWREFGESSALRIKLDEVMESSAGAATLQDVQAMMESAYEACIGDAIAAMPRAVAEVIEA